MEDEKQPIFVRGAVVGRGPRFKSVGSHLDLEEISVETQPGSPGICWLLLLVPGDQGLPESQMQRKELAGGAARAGTGWRWRGVPHTRQVLGRRPALCLTTPARL